MEDSLHAAAYIGLFDDLVRCETRLYNALNDRLRAAHGIVTSQFESLRYLRDHPGCRVADLAAHFAIGVGATSKGLDRLEARGWIRRTPNPADRRSPRLELTPDGTTLLAEAEPTVTAGLATLIDPTWSEPDRRAVATAMAALRSALEQARVGTPTG